MRQKLALPHVGERVRSKKSGRIWKVVEEKEIWLKELSAVSNSDDDPHMIPAIYIRYWGEEIRKETGKDKILSFKYSQKDPSFQDHWEILYDW